MASNDPAFAILLCSRRLNPTRADCLTARQQDTSTSKAKAKEREIRLPLISLRVQIARPTSRILLQLVERRPYRLQTPKKKQHISCHQHSAGVIGRTAGRTSRLLCFGSVPTSNPSVTRSSPDGTTTTACRPHLFGVLFPPNWMPRVWYHACQQVSRP